MNKIMKKSEIYKEKSREKVTQPRIAVGEVF
jgi:hypothetical protein